MAKRLAIVAGGVAAACVLALGGCARHRTALHYYLRSRLDAQKGHINAAIAELSMAINKQPRLALAYSSQADLYKKRGDYRAAAKDYASAARLEPFDFHSHYELGLVEQYLSRFAAAVRAYQQALQIRPLSPHANVNLALVYVQTGRDMQALGYADRLRNVARLPGDVNADLGAIYAQVASSMPKGAKRTAYRDRAIESYKISLEKNPHAGHLYLDLSAEYMHMRQWEPAREVLSTAAALAPGRRQSNRLGLCCYMLHRYADAATAYKAALKFDPTSKMALNGLGVVRMTQSLRASPPDTVLARAALSCWRSSLKIDPSQPLIQKLVRKYGGRLASDAAAGGMQRDRLVDR